MAILNSDERNLILVQGLYFFADALAGVFVTIYIYAHSNFQTVLLYTSINFMGLLFWMILSGRLMEKISSGNLVRAGLALNALFYLSLFLLHDSAVHYFVLLAALDGTAAGIFWAGLNLNQYVYSQLHTRVRYFGMQGVINNLLRAAGPIIGGLLITFIGKNVFLGVNVGYTILFLSVSVVYFLSAVFIGKLPEHEFLHFSYKKLFTHKRSILWKLVLWQQALFGLFDVLLGTMIGVLTYVVVKQELYVGLAQTSLFITNAVGAFIAIKLLEKYKQGFWVGSIGLSSAILGFALLPNIFGLACFIIVYGLTAQAVSTWLATVFYHTLDREKINWRTDFHVLMERDIAIGIPRILSYIILVIFISGGNQLARVWNWLYVLAIFPIILGILFMVHGRRIDE